MGLAGALMALAADRPELRAADTVDLDQVDPNPHAGHTMLGVCRERFL